MSRWIPSLLAAAMGLTLFGGCDQGSFVSEQRVDPRIIGGSADTVDTAVVALEYKGQEFCTGTLIAPRVVLSAGHCLMMSGFTKSDFPDITVFFGQKVGGSGANIQITDFQAHPNWAQDPTTVVKNDVSVLTLAQDAPVAPMAWQQTAIGNIVGKAVTFVGYGVTNATQTGNDARRQVGGTISSQDSEFIYSGNGKSGTCQGDSGGPTLLSQSGTPTVIAVTSYGDGSCVNESADTRIDPYTDFISSFIKGCTPNCSGKQCGSDGCGKTCGTCSSGTCNSSGQCAVCTPNCSGKQCGDDGCGKSCGTCSNGSCNASGQL